MRYAILLLLLVLTASARADHKEKMPARKAVLLDGLGNVHHPVSTKNAEAQKFFDQGLRLIYAFNHDEAYLAFERAAELDPKLAMAYWGMALAVGPNYNLDAEEAALKKAYKSIQTGLALAKDAPEHEQEYVRALSVRYYSDPRKADKKQQAQKYAMAMKVLHLGYPDDLDAATLYAESLMNLTPWELWTRDGKPNQRTEKILELLEGVLRRNPEHTGANHYYIHAIEASPFPERGLAAADRLGKLAPKAGHLVHMPAHIYARVGAHAAAARANDEAAKVDRDYILKFKVHGVYPMMYYSHNLHFLAVAHHMQGRFADAKKAADQLTAHLAPHALEMPMIDFFLPTATLVLVRFQRWDDIVKLKEPDAKLPLSRSIWHFARGSAFASRGNIKEAEKELAAFVIVASAIPADATHSGRNKSLSILSIPEYVLLARIALAKGDMPASVAWLEKAVAAEDKLNYIEPADWHLPTRELLGAVQVRAKQFAQAEKVFRADLVHNPRNPRALFGLMESLKAQVKMHAASLVEQEFRAAWRHADAGALSLAEY